MFNSLLGGESSSATWKSAGKEPKRYQKDSKRDRKERDEKEKRDKTLLLDKVKNKPTMLMSIEMWVDAMIGWTPLRYVFCSYHPKEMLFGSKRKNSFPRRWIKLLGYDEDLEEDGDIIEMKTLDEAMSESETKNFLQDRDLAVKVRATNNIRNVVDLVSLSWLSYLTGESKYRKISKKAILENQWNSVGILSALMATIAIEMATLASDSDYDEGSIINRLYVCVWLGSFTALIISTCCSIMLIVATAETSDEEAFEVFISILDGIFFGASVAPFFFFYIGGCATIIGTFLYTFVFYYEIETSIICLTGVFILGFFYIVHLLCVASALQCTNQMDKFIQIHYPKCTELSMIHIKNLLKKYIEEELEGRIENLGADITDTEESVVKFADDFLEFVSLQHVKDEKGKVVKRFGCDLSYVLKERARILFTEYVRKSCFVENLSVDSFSLDNRAPVDVMSRK